MQLESNMPFLRGAIAYLHHISSYIYPHQRVTFGVSGKYTILQPARAYHAQGLSCVSRIAN